MSLSGHFSRSQARIKEEGWNCDIIQPKIDRRKFICSSEHFLCVFYSLFVSIQGALLTWETHVNIAKASEVDNIQKYTSDLTIQQVTWPVILFVSDFKPPGRQLKISYSMCYLTVQTAGKNTF